MKFSTAAIATLFSAGALAAPAAEQAVSQMAASPEWTIQRMQRVCNTADTSCTWTFGINMHGTAAPTACTFTVKGSPASEASSTGNTCGVFTVSSGWSGQFGPGNGFTTLAVVNNNKKQIIYPAYTDTELANGTVVSPNKSYAPANLPTN